MREGDLNNVTVIGNKADADGNGTGGGGGVAGGFTKNTIGREHGRHPGLATASSDCAGTSLGHNLIGSTVNCSSFTPATGDIIGVDPYSLRWQTTAARPSPTRCSRVLRRSAAPVESAPTDQRGAAQLRHRGYEFATCGKSSSTALAPRARTPRGTSAADGILALDGKDTLGGSPARTGSRGNGKDILKGGKGKDKLIGGKGNDKLSGGGGKTTARAAKARTS